MGDSHRPSRGAWRPPTPKTAASSTQLLRSSRREISFQVNRFGSQELRVPGLNVNTGSPALEASDKPNMKRLNIHHLPPPRWPPKYRKTSSCSSLRSTYFTSGKSDCFPRSAVASVQLLPSAVCPWVPRTTAVVGVLGGGQLCPPALSPDIPGARGWVEEPGCSR